MTEYAIIYWRDIPAQIKLRDETGRAGQPLSRRFSAAISAAALHAGLTASDDYLAMWRNGAWTAVSGNLDCCFATADYACRAANWALLIQDLLQNT